MSEPRAEQTELHPQEELILRALACHPLARSFTPVEFLKRYKLATIIASARYPKEAMETLTWVVKNEQQVLDLIEDDLSKAAKMSIEEGRLRRTVDTFASLLPLRDHQRVFGDVSSLC